MLVLLGKPQLREPRRQGHRLGRRAGPHVPHGAAAPSPDIHGERARAGHGHWALYAGAHQLFAARRPFQKRPCAAGLRLFERQFAGVRPFEMELKPAPGRDIYDLAVLQETERIEGYLRDTYGLRFAASPVTLVKSVRKALNGGGLAEYRLPTDTTELKRLRSKLKLFRKKAEFSALALPDGSAGRLTGRMADVGSIRADALNDALRRHLRATVDSTVLRTRLTGSSNLIDKNNENLTLNMIQGMAIDVLMVTLIVLALFKSLRMTLVVLIPNLLPIIIVAGVMGLAGVSMKVSTSIIFTIAFGIAVDDTIHFISKLRLTLGHEPDIFKAVRRTYLLAGKAVITTSLILVGGFSTLLFLNSTAPFMWGC
ncbi:MMPL family transporter [Hymenobacter humi]|uniref:MMPL family transporter n=1 Tax=Hymenobacter humi TaxID=1411620 RepID=A0ABW2U7C9_9BACT